MDDKRHHTAWRTARQVPSGQIGQIYRHARMLRERQPAWNALLPLEAQDRTWLVDWSKGTLKVLCQSSVWISWLRRHEKTLLKQWNDRFPEAPAIRIDASVRPWPQWSQPPSKLRKTPHIAPTAPQSLLAVTQQVPEPVAAALRRWAATLDMLQAETLANASAKENGARFSE